MCKWNEIIHVRFNIRQRWPLRGAFFIIFIPTATAKIHCRAIFTSFRHKILLDFSQERVVCGRWKRIDVHWTAVTLEICLHNSQSRCGFGFSSRLILVLMTRSLTSPNFHQKYPQWITSSHFFATIFGRKFQFSSSFLE